MKRTAISGTPVMLSPRGQAGLEAKILSSASDSASKICPRPQPRPGALVLGLSSNFLFWPRENVCNDGIGNISKFATIILHSTSLFCNHSSLACSVCLQGCKFCPVERIFSQSGLIMSARRAHMSNAVLETLVFLKCNSHL